MISAIIPYVSSYDDVRASCGMSNVELTDVELALDTYKNTLGIELDSHSGVYTESEGEETLQEMFDRLGTTDPMSAAIQQFSICVVANAACGSVGLKAIKTLTDGKSSMTRFSAESTFQSTQESTTTCMQKWLTFINALLGVTTAAGDDPLITAVKPAIDPVTGA